MKITRTVNGQEMEFELTEEELVAAYFEHKVTADKEWMREIFEDRFSDEYKPLTDEQLNNAYGVYLDTVPSYDYDIAESSIDVVLGDEDRKEE